MSSKKNRLPRVFKYRTVEICMGLHRFLHFGYVHLLIKFNRKLLSFQVNSHGSKKTLQGLKTLWKFQISCLGRSYMIYFYKEGYPLYLPVSHSFSSCCLTVRFKFSNFRVIRGFVWTCPRLPSVASDDKRAIGSLCFLLLGDVMREKSRRRVSNSSFPVCFLLGKVCREDRIEVRKAIQGVISTNRYFERAAGIF